MMPRDLNAPTPPPFLTPFSFVKKQMDKSPLINSLQNLGIDMVDLLSLAIY